MQSAQALPDVHTVHVPAFAPVILRAPERTGRAVDNLALVLERAEVRLRLAWLYRDKVDPALPEGFHARAWTALHALGGGDADETVEDTHDASAPITPTAAAALVALEKKVSTLRGAVEYTTRPGDAAREALRFGDKLTANRGLLPLARDVIAGARRVRARFPALTDAVLDDASRALATARAAVRGARGATMDQRVTHVAGADAHQLALDVLLDAVDHLRAAAHTTLRPVAPHVAEWLMAPLEPQSKHAAEEAGAGAASAGAAATGAAGAGTTAAS